MVTGAHAVHQQPAVVGELPLMCPGNGNIAHLRNTGGDIGNGQGVIGGVDLTAHAHAFGLAFNDIGNRAIHVCEGGFCAGDDLGLVIAAFVIALDGPVFHNGTFGNGPGNREGVLGIGGNLQVFRVYQRQRRVLQFALAGDVKRCFRGDAEGILLIGGQAADGDHLPGEGKGFLLFAFGGVGDQPTVSLLTVNGEVEHHAAVSGTGHSVKEYDVGLGGGSKAVRSGADQLMQAGDFHVDLIDGIGLQIRKYGTAVHYRGGELIAKSIHAVHGEKRIIDIGDQHNGKLIFRTHKLQIVDGLQIEILV